MDIPYQKKVYKTKKLQRAFSGLDRRLKADSGKLRDMYNMSSREEKCAATRLRRGTLDIDASSIRSMICTDVLIDGEIRENAFLCDTGDRLIAHYYDGDILKKKALFSTARFTTCKNRLIASGGYLYFFPDKLYVNLMNTSDKGALECEYELYSGLHTVDGTEYFYELLLLSCNEDGTAEETDSGYVKIQCIKYKSLSGTKGERIGNVTFGFDFEVNDCISLIGFSGFDGYVKVKHIPNDYSYIVLKGTVTEDISFSGTVTMKRSIPDMDYVVASGNRLWGCRYGVTSDGIPVNEIYSSALGDAKNWNRFDGISTDSYRASLGADGKFTGAVVYGGNPVFFKENSIITVYGSRPSDFSVVTSNFRGIENGSSDSAVIVNDILYYKSNSGIVAYNGGLPRNVDAPLGDTKYKNARSGRFRGKYYISMEQYSGEPELYVYDTESGNWFKEDDLRIRDFCICNSELYMLSDKVYSVNGSGNALDEEYPWFIETAELGSDSPYLKSVELIEARIRNSGEPISIEVEYDGDGIWRYVTYKSSEKGRITASLPHYLCDTYRLRISGEGDCELLSLCVTETYFKNAR